MIQSQLRPAFERVLAAIDVLVEFNHRDVEASSQKIMAAVTAARVGFLGSFAIVLVLLVSIGYSLWRAITRPLGQLVAAMDMLRQGDFGQRLDLHRQDEFGLLAVGFNNMTDEIQSLIGHVQRSGIQVNTSIAEIAATSKLQQATASEIAATATEIFHCQRRGDADIFVSPS